MTTKIAGLANLDDAALDAVCELRGLVRLAGPDDDPVVLLSPRQAGWRKSSWDFTSFDRAVCAAGVKEYVRPLSRADVAMLPAGADDGRADHVHVSELTPGVRSRFGVTLDLGTERN